MRHKVVILPLISALFLTFASCRQSFFVSEGKTWGTTYHIVYDGERELDKEIKAILRQTDEELSMFNPSSLVSRINAGTDSVASEHFRRVFELSQSVSELSGGYYDPTVGPLSEIWGFGRHEIAGEPTDSLIAEALSAVGIRDCSISGNNIVRKKSPATVFDFSSVAKGYGIDLVGRMLEENGVENYMIEIGGEILLRGSNPKGKPWHIQVDAPTSGLGHERMVVLSLGPEKTAVASSGDYRNFRRRSDGSTYGHTLSPVTGRPVAGMVPAATIIASDCAAADALATACMAVGQPDSAVALITRAGVRGIVADGRTDATPAVRYVGL